VTRISAFSLVATVLMLSACSHEPPAAGAAPTPAAPAADATATATTEVERAEQVDDEDIPEAVRRALAAARAQGAESGGGPIQLDADASAALMDMMRERSEAQRTRWIDKPFPVTELVDLEGNGIDLVGGRTVVNFWATWCAPCIKEMPLFEALDAEDNGVRVVTVSNDFSREPLNAFLAQTPLQLPVVFDSDKALAEAAGVRAWPASFALDSDGRIENIFGMVPDMDALRKAVGVD
jgi:thiol-disulfide isomerase/thioredoxin